MRARRLSRFRRPIVQLRISLARFGIVKRAVQAGELRQVVRLLGIKSGMTVADVGAGSGYYVVRLSPIVGPRGRVIAEDVVPEYLRGLRKRVRDLGLQNVAIGLGKPHDPRLPADSLDIAILAHMYHEIAQPYALLYNLIPALKPGARVGIVDTFRRTSEHGTPPSLLRCELAAVGYREIILDRPHGQRRLSCDLRATIRREPDAAGSHSSVQSAIRDHCASSRALAIRLRAAGVGSWSPSRAAWAPWRQHVRRLDCLSQFQAGSEHGDANAAIDLAPSSVVADMALGTMVRITRYYDSITDGGLNVLGNGLQVLRRTEESAGNSNKGRTTSWRYRQAAKRSQ